MNLVILLVKYSVIKSTWLLLKWSVINQKTLMDLVLSLGRFGIQHECLLKAQFKPRAYNFLTLPSPAVPPLALRVYGVACKAIPIVRDYGGASGAASMRSRLSMQVSRPVPSATHRCRRRRSRLRLICDSGPLILRAWRRSSFLINREPASAPEFGTGMGGCRQNILRCCWRKTLHIDTFVYKYWRRKNVLLVSSVLFFFYFTYRYNGQEVILYYSTKRRRETSLGNYWNLFLN